MNMRSPYLYVAVTLTLLTAVPIVGLAGDRTSQDPFEAGGNQSFDSFQKESEASMKMDGDRGAPGINSGGQDIKPGEGEQDGRPGTIGGVPSLPPQKEALQYEGADKGRKTRVQPRAKPQRPIETVISAERTSSRHAPPGPCSSSCRSDGSCGFAFPLPRQLLESRMGQAF